MILSSSRLKSNFLGLELENPFILSAGPSTDELDIARAGLDAGWAGLILKTTSLPATDVDLVYPMMSSFHDSDGFVGMGNIDLISIYHLEEVVDRISILKSEYPEKMIAASIMSDSKRGWQTLVRALKDADVDLIECSFSCPQGNVGEDPGKMLAQSESAAETVAGWVKEAAEDLPVLIKITPQVTDIAAIAGAILRSKCDGITASNSIPALMGVDIDSLTPIPRVDGYSAYSGLSGRAIKPITLRTIAEISRHFTSAIISGNGGISNWRDSVEVLAVGASNIQICTAVMLHGFGIIEDLTSGLDNYLSEKGFSSVTELVGRALPKLVSHDQLPRHQVRSAVDIDRCIGCGRCFVSCRDGGHMAITWDSVSRLPDIDEEKCVGCGLCLLVQPVDGCLSLKRVDR